MITPKIKAGSARLTKKPKNTQILALREKYNKKNSSDQVPIIEAFGKSKADPDQTKQAK